MSMFTKIVRRLPPVGLSLADSHLVEVGMKALGCTQADLVRNAIRYYLLCVRHETLPVQVQDKLRQEYGDIGVEVERFWLAQESYPGGRLAELSHLEKP